LLLGECKWVASPVGVGVIREFIEEKTPQSIAALCLKGGKERQVYQSFFTRARFTEPAQQGAVRLIQKNNNYPNISGFSGVACGHIG